ncbi:MAG: KH domain-containing protein [Candidatus Moranbacteria bacterium]|nr:KH domain-containing protein [Candidatus Moranbacteria bacterium]
MAKKEFDQEFVDFIVKAIVDHPDDVKTTRSVDEMGVLITLDVNPKDMGMVIGREGATAKSLRTLLKVVGARNNARVNLKINEPEGSRRGSSSRKNEEKESKEEDKKEKKNLDDVVEDLKI